MRRETMVRRIGKRKERIGGNREREREEWGGSRGMEKSKEGKKGETEI